MSRKKRWLVWVLPLGFLGLILGVAWLKDPDFWRSSAALFRLAEEAAVRGDLRGALTPARKVWSRQPENSGYGTFLGWVYLQGGQPQAALEVSRQVWNRDPKAVEALKIQALALELLGERQKAQELLAGYLKEKPEDPEILKSAAEIATRHSEDHSLAVTYYQRLYQLAPDPLVRRPLVGLLLSLNRFQEAIPLQEEEVAQFSEDKEALHQLALLYYWQRDYQAATQVYQRLLERAAQDAALRLEAAKSAEAAQQVDQALANYLWLYGHHQGKKEYALALARLWSKKGNHAEAAGVLAPLMQEQPEAEVRRWYALELLLIKDFGKSLQAYEAAWKEGDTHKETIINLARLYAQKGHFVKAASLWDEAGRRHLLEGELRWEAALTYSYARRFAEALEVLQPLHRAHPQDPRLLLFFGQMYFYQKNWDQAVHYFKVYLEKNPRDAEVRRQLAEVLSFKPETREAALDQYGEALKLKDEVPLRLRRIHLLLQARRWEDAARELKDCPVPAQPQLIREQARLWLWLGDLQQALKNYRLFLKHAPLDRGGRLELARVLTYLGRTPEALELLNRLRLEAPRDPTVRVAAIEAYLSAKDFTKALILAQKELEPLPDLSIDERALVARCYAHTKDPPQLYRATELLLQNLKQNRHHHPSLLILTSLLPRLPRYEDLDRVLNAMPGIKVGGPEFAASLAYFGGRLGRQGGKLDYLLHVLKEYRRHHWPDNPGELLGLAWLATELGEHQPAMAYYRRALELRPHDQSIAKLLYQWQMVQKDWGQALVSLKKQGDRPEQALETARLYLIRGQYEGVKAVVAGIPEGQADRGPALLLLAQAYRLEGNYPEALKTLDKMQGQIPREEWLMEKARALEAQGDKGAVGLYEEIIDSRPDSQAARVARARQDRARGNWAAAYKAFAAALREAPQDIELLNELENIRQQMRPQVASRGFPWSRGPRRPEEALRPWQFSRFGPQREPVGLGLSNLFPSLVADVLPIVQPESLGFTDSNKLYGGIFRMSGAFWITKVLPAQVGAEYREYNQTSKTVVARIGNQEINNHVNSRLRRAEVSLGLGPLSVEDRLRISGEIIGRRYWKRVDYSFRNIIDVSGTGTLPFDPAFRKKYSQIDPYTYILVQDSTEKEARNRLFGSLNLTFPLGPRTEATLRYGRRDVFDQEAYIYPRLYQGVMNLEKVRLTTYHQAEAAFDHQFRAGLNWRGSLGGAFYSDQNRRLTLYQGLAWQALRQKRMHLEFTPHFYLAAYSYRREGYFSPHNYWAMGLGVDFDRQIFRLPTLILQGTAQGVNNQGQWGPALQGLAALEWEFIHNFYTDLHVFYFREWVDNYRLLTAGVSFRWNF
ncbi:MAG: tetratricopeptide repeat protein [Desulfobaccales bacterium]|nr:tetratricopeptide repeat protein [Desulfobaccales bacterium]